MKRNRKSQQLNTNAGFSLVELLVAVTILAIIAIPMLHMFVTSARINGKSRITLRATVLAQDVVEGLKAYRIEEIQDQFNQNEDFEMLSSSIVDGDCTYWEATSDQDPAGKYYFVIKNACLEKSRFDVKISIDATGYMKKDEDSGESEDSDTAGHDTYLNTGDIARIAGMNKSTDAYYEQPATMNDEALAAAVKKLEIPGDVTYKTAGLQCERTFQVTFLNAGTVTDEDGNTVNQTDAYVNCSYAFTYKGKSFTYIPDGMSPTGIPCGSFTGSNFYFFYNPLYDAVKDKLILDGTAADWTKEKPVHLYIAKQTDTLLTDSELNKAETQYKPVVNVLTTSMEQFQIYTNLGTNLVNEEFLKSIGTTVPDETRPASIKQLKGLAVFQFNGAATAKTLDIFDLSGIRDTNYGKDGADDEVTELIYDIVVEVYEDGAADQDFPTEMRELVFDGTKL